MKKLIILSLLLASCKEGPEPGPGPIKDVGVSEEIILRYRMSTVKIGECEYLQWAYDRSAGMTHKGDCQNPAHCR